MHKRGLHHPSDKRSVASGSHNNTSETVPKGNFRTQRCDLCGCDVPRNAWDQHVAGIRHRRNQLSEQLHGSVGRLVVSVFERDAQAPPQELVDSRYLTKDPVHRAVRASAAVTQQPPTQPGPGFDVNQLHSHVKKQIVHLTGVGSLYHRVIEKLSCQQLQQALGTLLPKLERYQQQRCKHQQHQQQAGASHQQHANQQQVRPCTTAAPPAGPEQAAPGPSSTAQALPHPPQQPVHAGGRGRRKRRPRDPPFLDLSPAEICALSAICKAAASTSSAASTDHNSPAARRAHRQDRSQSTANTNTGTSTSRTSINTSSRGSADPSTTASTSRTSTNAACVLPELSITVPYHPYGAEAAAYASALCVLLPALQRHAPLTTVRLQFSQGEYMSVMTQRGAGGATQQLSVLWAHVLGAIRSLVQVHMGVRQVQLSSPPHVISPADVEQLQRAMLDPAPRQRPRMAVLMGAHHRAGKSSPIRWLPHQVLETILDLAVPRQPCRLTWTLQAWVPGLRDTSSSSGSDDEDKGFAFPGLVHEMSESDESDSSSSSSGESDEVPDDEGGGVVPADVLAASRWLS